MGAFASKPSRRLVGLLSVAVFMVFGAAAAPSSDASPHRQRTFATFKVAVPPSGGVTLMSEVLVVKNARSKHGLPQKLSLKISHVPAGMTVVGKAWLAKALLHGHPAYSLVVEVLHPKAAHADARARAADIDLLSGVAQTERDEKGRLIERVRGVGGTYTVVIPETLTFTTSPPPICEEVTSEGEIVPIVGDSAGPIDEIVSNTLTPNALARDGAIALCRPPAPAAFYKFMDIPEPSTSPPTSPPPSPPGVTNPSCSGFSAARIPPGEPQLGFTCSFGSKEGSYIYGQGWSTTLTATINGAYVVSEASGSWGQQSSSPGYGPACMAGANPFTAICSPEAALGFNSGPQYVSWEVTNGSSGFAELCGATVSAKVEVTPPGGSPIVVGSAEGVAVKC